MPVIIGLAAGVGFILVITTYMHITANRMPERKQFITRDEALQLAKSNYSFFSIDSKLSYFGFLKYKDTNPKTGYLDYIWYKANDTNGSIGEVFLDHVEFNPNRDGLALEKKDRFAWVFEIRDIGGSGRMIFIDAKGGEIVGTFFICQYCA